MNNKHLDSTEILKRATQHKKDIGKEKATYMEGVLFGYFNMLKDTKLLDHLNPLIIDGVNNLNQLCKTHKLEDYKDEDKLAYKLVHLAGKLHRTHKYFYFEENIENLGKRDLRWLLNYNFQETQKNTYVFGNQNTGVLVCVRVVGVDNEKV